MLPNVVQATRSNKTTNAIIVSPVLDHKTGESLEYLQELEGFTFATALDLNMGYYTICLDPDMHSKSAPLFFHGESTLTTGYLWV